MKNKYLIVGLFAIVLAIGAMCFKGNSDDVVYAEDNNVSVVTPEGVDYIVEKHTDISVYRTKDADGYYSSPSAQTTGEWVFAGWYKDAACSVAVKTSSGEAYAKFVSADVLSVKCQISTNTTQESESTLLRCISSVDTLKYSYVGFDLITPTETKNMKSSKVGTRIQVTEDKKSNPCNYSPKVVDTESEYFFSAVETINNADFGKGFLIKPYWITKDDTKVYGVSKYVVINDALGQSAIYIPVKKSTEPTGTFTIDENSVDCVEYDVDGGYAHLKYIGTLSDSVTKLEVKGGDANAPIYYRNLNTKYTGTNADQTWYTAYEGTSEDEFVIATNADLYGLTTTNETFDGKTIYLCADIEANKGEATEGGWDKTKVAAGTEGTEFKWIPIPKVFNGTFDGQGHIISGINAQSDYRTALFAWTGSNSVIQNFDLLNSYFECKNYNAGSVVGRVDGKISNVYSNAIVVGDYANGGIAGSVYANSGDIQIENCHFAGSVSSKGNVAGGIVGSQYNAKAIITNCTVSGKVNAGLQYVGGIYGTSYSTSFGNLVNVEITGCKVTKTASITTSKDNTGGLVGYITDGNLKITSSSFGGNLTTSAGLKGGLVGHVVGGTVTIDDSSFAGNMTVTNWSGGFIGKVDAGTVTIQQSNSNGTIDASGTQLGGLVGYVTGGEVTIQQSNFAGDLEASGSTGGLVGQVEGGKVTIDESSFETTGELAAGYAVGGLVGRVKYNDVNKTTSIVEIKNNSSFAGNLTGTDIFTGGVVGYVENGNVTIDNSSFAGNLTGQAYTGGVVGYVENGDVEIQASNSNGTITVNSGDYAGGLVGAISGDKNTTIESSYFDGELTSTLNYVGGIVGRISAASTINIQKCYSDGTVIGLNNVGGIIGSIAPEADTVKMESCLNKASVTSTLKADGVTFTGDSIGGLVGRLESGSDKKLYFKYCLNTGVVQGDEFVGSLIGWLQGGEVTFDATYATTTSNATGTDTKKAISNIAVGSDQNRTCAGMVNITEITVSNANAVTPARIRTVLSELFAEGTIWTIRDEEGSMPELNLTK